MQLGNALNWFEIPVNNFERAKNFYETIFSYEMPENTMGPARMGFFLYDYATGKVGGAIVYRPDFYTAADNGMLVYLNCQPDLQIVLDKVKVAGGTVLNEKVEVAPGLGFWTLIKIQKVTGWSCILSNSHFE